MTSGGSPWLRATARRRLGVSSVHRRTTRTISEPTTSTTTTSSESAAVRRIGVAIDQQPRRAQRRQHSHRPRHPARRRGATSTGQATFQTFSPSTGEQVRLVQPRRHPADQDQVARGDRVLRPGAGIRSGVHPGDVQQGHPARARATSRARWRSTRRSSPSTRRRRRPTCGSASPTTRSATRPRPGDATEGRGARPEPGTSSRSRRVRPRRQRSDAERPAPWSPSSRRATDPVPG